MDIRVKRTVIAVDGPAGSGKSTIARRLAKERGFTYIDTGAMYRAVALKAHEDGIDIEDEQALGELCSTIDIRFKNEGGENKIFVDGEDYSGKIRSPLMSRLSSKVSAKKIVRDAMVEIQRRMACSDSIIMEGRDIGTVVFPDADVKFYLDASPEVRGKRRYLELKEKGHSESLETVIAEVKARDEMDSSRRHAPLKKADDAVYIDTSDLALSEVVSLMINIIKERLSGGNFCS